MATKRADEFTAGTFGEIEIFVGQKDADNSSGQRQLIRVDRASWLAALTAAIVTPALSPLDGSFRVKNGKILQMYNPDTLKWHTFYPAGADGQVTTAWGAGEV